MSLYYLLSTKGMDLRAKLLVACLVTPGLTHTLRNYFLGLTEFKYGIFNYVLVILLSFSYYFR